MTQALIFTSKDVSTGKVPGLKKPKKQKEEKVQIKVCEYLHKAYPNIIFTCDLSSGMRLPIHIAAKNKKMRSSRGLPDLFIASAKIVHQYADESGNDRSFRVYYGLFLELKADGVVLFNKDLTLRKSDHIGEQAVILEHLRQEGYAAMFAVGFDQAKTIIDEYLKK